MDAPTRIVNVLLVDKDSSVADAAAGFLECLGHRVWLATSGSHALSVVAELGIPDLILSGLHLTGKMDGVDLVNRLRADTKRIIPAIIMTGDTSSIRGNRVAGVTDCRLYRKPFDRHFSCRRARKAGSFQKSAL